MPIRVPDKNPDGSVSPHDHEEILGEDRLIRRITKHHLTDREGGGQRLSSAAFEPSDDGQVSVDIEKLIIEAGIDPAEFSGNLPSLGSIAFKAQQLRDEQLLVGYDPIVPENEFHGGVWSRTGKMSSGLRKRIIRQAEWLKKIPDVVIE